MRANETILKNRTLALLALIMILGVALRVHNLEGPSLWFDEFSTLKRASASMENTISSLSDASFPPFYYMIMNVWLNVAGESVAALRIPSVFFSLLTIPAIFLLAREMFDKNVGLIAAFLLAISVYAINYAQDAKMYTLFWFFSVLSLLFFYKFIKNATRTNMMLYALYTAICIYTQYIGFVLIIAHNIIFFVFFRKEIKKWLAAQAAILLFYTPWIAKLLFDVSNTTGIGWAPQVNDYLGVIVKIFLIMSSYYIGKPQVLELALICIIVLSAALAARTAFVKKTAQSDPLKILLSYIALGVIIFVTLDIAIIALFGKSARIMVGRYLGFIHIPLIIFFAFGIEKIPRLNLPAKYFAIGLIALFAVTAHLEPYYENELKISGQDWKGIVGGVCKTSSENSLILVTPFSPILAYYGDCIKGETGKYSSYRENRIPEKFDMVIVIFHDLQFPKEEREKFYQINAENFEPGQTFSKGTIGYTVFLKKSLND